MVVMSKSRPCKYPLNKNPAPTVKQSAPLCVCQEFWLIEYFAPSKPSGRYFAMSSAIDRSPLA